MDVAVHTTLCGAWTLEGVCLYQARNNRSNFACAIFPTLITSNDCCVQCDNKLMLFV